ncbi:MAG: alpha-1,2-fucosyltransferase [Bacteroidaceae bacterium]|nr:alpha-1,2-fucosyltransferase [Bacteroidaceae bacterium]
MLLVRDKGQMCNNIIQFAHAYAWAREHNIRAVSMRFAYKYRYFHICNTKYHNLFFYLLGKFGAKLKLIPTVDYNDFSQELYAKNEKELLEHKGLCILQGWSIRHYDLVEKYLDEIRKLFKITATEGKEASLSGATIGVHIRRGDYATFMKGRFFFSDECYINYIRQAAELIDGAEGAKGKKTNVVICTNDRNINLAEYKRQLPNIDISLSDGSAIEDLYTLSQCDYLIGAPSSYSLVATLYDKAKLFVITSENEKLALSSFKDFMTQLRLFDDYFRV